MSEKTEEPTEQRLRRARADGDTGASAFLSQSIGFLAAATALPWAFVAISARFEGLVRRMLAMSSAGTPEDWLPSILVDVVDLSLPVLLAAAFASLILHFVQTGGLWTMRPLAPDLTRLNPISGLRGLLSPLRMFAVLRALVLMFSVALLVWQDVPRHAPALARVTARPEWGPHLLRGWMVPLLAKVIALTLAFAVFDAWFTRFARMRRLRMSRAEVIREHRETEGDPLLKAERDELRKEAATEATMGDLSRARVVVRNPTEIACALRYDVGEGDHAPLVIAKAYGAEARRLVAEARLRAIPVVTDVPVAQALAALPLGEGIPERLYEAVALILRELDADTSAHHEPG